MSIENHEYIDNKNNGINILAKEFGSDNDPKFGYFLNKRFDEILKNESYSHLHETCRNSRNSNNFYKYLVLCKRGLINDSLVKNNLERLVKNNNEHSEIRITQMTAQIFTRYKGFISKTNLDQFGYINESINKSDYNEFLRSSILATSLTYGEGGNPKLYEIITSHNFLTLKIRYGLLNLYKKVNKSKDKSQSWDDFFCNGRQSITAEIKRMYDKYMNSPTQRKIEKNEQIDKRKVRESLKHIICSDDFLDFLTDTFYELNDDRLLEKDFINTLFFGVNNSGINFLDYGSIQDSFNLAKEKVKKNIGLEGDYNKYKEEIKRSLKGFIPNFYSVYTNIYLNNKGNRSRMPIFQFFDTFNNYNFVNSEGLNNGMKPKQYYGNGFISTEQVLVGDTNHIGLNSPLNIPFISNRNTQPANTGSVIDSNVRNTNGNIQPTNTGSVIDSNVRNTDGNIQPANTGSVIDSNINTGGKDGKEIDMQNIVEYIKNNDSGFKMTKEIIENRGIYLSDEDIVYVMLYNSSISNDNKITPAQKHVVINILEANPSISRIGKEILENTIRGHINFDSQVITLNSKGEDDGFKQSKENVEGLNQYFVNIQKKLMTLVDTDNIKNYCDSIVPEIKFFEHVLGCNNLIAEKISTSISSFSILNKIKGRDDYNTRGLFMLYLMLTDYKNIGKINNDNIDKAIDTFIGGGSNTGLEFSDIKLHRKQNLENYQEFIRQRITEYDQNVLEYNNWITARYEKARAEAENRKFYGADYINFSRTSDNLQDQSGVQLASRIDNLDKKLSHYKFKKSKSDINDHEKSALMYTAFETTFNNTFNTNDIIVQKLVDLKIDLRSELTNYGIYDKEKNSFDENARNKFVKDRLLNTGFSIEEIETLGRTMKEFPDEVEKNKEILSSTDGFYTDEDNLEKISKIYALGEIIDNIRTLYSGQKLGNSMNLQLDEESPADIIGDCLFIKGKINGTETNIKYDLRTGKVYMNSFTEQILNPPKIIIGNTTPNTLIGDFGSFEDAISNMNSAFEAQNDENNNLGNSSNLGNISEDNNDSMEIKQNPEDLVKNKLDDNLKEIGKKVKDKTGKQTQENNIINNFLKTFGISSDTGESKEFTGGSKLYTILNNFMKIEDESDLIEISKLMKKLFRLFSLSRGEDNQTLTENGSNLDQDDDSSSYDIESLSIFDIDKEHASEEIKYLQIETRKFFSDGNSDGGEKEKVKNLAHFDESVNISIIDVIVDKCCSKGELSKDNIKNYIVEIKNQIIDSRNNSKLMADAGRIKELESIMDNIA